MASNKSVENSKANATVSKDLLCCEYVDAKENIIQKLLHKDRKCPQFKFEKSSVLEKVMNFIPEMQKSQVELDSKSPSEYNIEEVDENSPVIEFDIGLVENTNRAFALLCEDDSNSSQDDDESDDDEKSDDEEESNTNNASSLSNDERETGNQTDIDKKKQTKSCLIEVLPDKFEHDENT